MPNIGHNVGGIAGERLLQLIERIERLESEKSGLAADIRDIYTEAASAGFDKKLVRKMVKFRAMDRQKLAEEQELTQLYASAIQLDLFGAA